MLRTGRANIIYSGVATWSAGTTYTSTQTLTFTVPASAGMTTLWHELIFSTNHTGSISADVRSTRTMGGGTVISEDGTSVTISGTVTVKGLAINGITTKIRGLCNNATGIIGMIPTTTSTATISAAISINCIIQELEGT